MNEQWLKNGWRIAAVHIVVILAVLLVPLFRGCLRKKPKEQIVAIIDLSTMPSPPEPRPEPRPGPRPEPRSEPRPEPEKREIKISREHVHRPNSENDTRLTPEEIRDMLRAGLPDDIKPTVKSDIPAWYYALVRQKMHNAWVEPTGLSLPRGTVTRIKIRVSRGGFISDRKLLASSGNSVMDKSVISAVRSVIQLKALPKEVRGDYREITIDFELEPEL